MYYELGQDKLLRRLQLDCCRDLCGGTCAYFEKLLGFSPAFEGTEGDAAGVVVD